MDLANLFQAKMEKADANPAAIKSFLRAFNLLKDGASFLISEDDISPAQDIPNMEDIPEVSSDKASQYLSQCVTIKLNGGLGTGMGLQSAKSLLEVRDGKTFLDLIVQQNNALKSQHGGEVKFLLMNSFSTSQGTNEFLQKYPEFADAGKVEMMQNFSPKIFQDSLEPAVCEANPDLEWCPPGHGDIYTALYGSGWLDKLLAAGVKYAFVSNSDNLGAFINPNVLSYFAEANTPFMMEVTRRTAADRKGGHLAQRVTDGQLLLREVAQTSDDDLDEFQDIDKHQFFNTNNIWLRLDLLKEVMDEQGGLMPLPVITNKKTVDPRDSSSAEVYQLEVAMGAAIECFKGARALCVPRRRFAPVKTTADLLSLRSDVYNTLDNGRIMLIPERNGAPPFVKLSKNFKFVDQMEKLGLPSLKAAESFIVDGKVALEDGVIIEGSVEFLNDTDELMTVPAGVYKDITVTPESLLTVGV